MHINMETAFVDVSGNYQLILEDIFSSEQKTTHAHY